MTNTSLSGNLRFEAEQQEKKLIRNRLDARIARCQSQDERTLVMDLFLAGKCFDYVEDTAICDGAGDPKGQCVHCGGPWHEHPV